MAIDGQHRLNQCGHADRRCRKFRGNVPHQHLNLAHRPGLPEELRRDIRHLVRLIQNDRFGAGQQIAEALVLERQVGQQQVVIHHDDIGRLRIAAGFNHMAARILRAFLAETVFARRGDAGPDRGLFRQVGELGQIAALGGRSPTRHAREQPRHAALWAQQRALLRGKLQSMAAQIICAPLEQCEFGRQSQRFCQHRHVAAKQLVLQRAGTGGNNDAAPGEQCRYEIGKRLARAGAGFDNQGFESSQRRPHRFGHHGLLGSIGVVRKRPRQRTAQGENVLIIGIHSMICFRRLSVDETAPIISPVREIAGTRRN